MLVGWDSCYLFVINQILIEFELVPSKSVQSWFHQSNNEILLVINWNHWSNIIIHSILNLIGKKYWALIGGRLLVITWKSESVKHSIDSFADGRFIILWCRLNYAQHERDQVSLWALSLSLSLSQCALFYIILRRQNQLYLLLLWLSMSRWHFIPERQKERQRENRCSQFFLKMEQEGNTTEKKIVKQKKYNQHVWHIFRNRQGFDRSDSSGRRIHMLVNNTPANDWFLSENHQFNWIIIFFFFKFLNRFS